MRVEPLMSELRPGRGARRRPLRRAAAVTAVAAALVPVLGTTAATATPRRHAASVAATVSVWETSGDGTNVIAPQSRAVFAPTPKGGRTPQSITVDPSAIAQPVAGFGATMTDSSAWVLEHDLSPAARGQLMRSLFSPTSGFGLDYLRVPIGATDFSTSDYTEDDQPAGATDPTLAGFNIAHDELDLVPAIQQALAVNPGIQILASPWTAPAWMKTNDSIFGGTLLAGDDAVYARYLVKFVQAYAAQGISISALTLQNEPEVASQTYPTMTLSPAQEDAIGPLVADDLAAAGLRTQIIGFDSDWSDVAYASTLLSSPGGSSFSGVAFHCYAGQPSQQLQIELEFPNVGIYETECSGYAAYPSYSGNLVNGVNSLIIGAMRDGSRTAMLWNLVLDQNDGPTNGGCQGCVPNVTVNSATGAVSYNVESYVLGQVSEFVQAGAHVIGSTASTSGGLESIAFVDPDGTQVLVVLNPSSSAQTFQVVEGSGAFTYAIPGASVQTFTWG